MASKRTPVAGTVPAAPSSSRRSPPARAGSNARDGAAPAAAPPPPAGPATPAKAMRSKQRPVPQAADRDAARPAAKAKAKAKAKPEAKPKTKPDAKPKTKPEAKAKAKAAKTDDAKLRKPKLLRDSFSIPKAEYAVIETLKDRAARNGSPARKSELLRAGIKALAAMDDAAFLAAVKQVPALKTGRPAKA